ncbi:MAG: Ku protein [Candidatus Binatia bacterium]
MAARAIGSATVSFGLVSIPVKLFSATESERQISFNLLHKKCGSRLKQQYICPQDEEIIGRDDMVKGYEFAKDQYVQFTPDEIKALEEDPTKAIEITEFVPWKEVDALYYDKPYFLGPDKGGDKAYKLLARAMADSGRVALAKYAARGKGYLVLLRPMKSGLVMHQLHYPDEIRSIDEVEIADLDVKDQELKLARQLIDQIANDEFRPENYQDEVRKRMEEQIQRKVEGQEISSAPVDTSKGKIIDLMEALKASLAEPASRSASKRGDSKGAEAKPAEERRPAKQAPRLTAVKKKAAKE